jgi:hypothetical protein
MSCDDMGFMEHSDIAALTRGVLPRWHIVASNGLVLSKQGRWVACATSIVVEGKQRRCDRAQFPLSPSNRLVYSLGHLLRI